MDFSLDYDCLLSVFSNFSSSELLGCGQVCREWNDLTRSNTLWKQLASNLFVPKDFSERFNSDYQQFYKHKANQDFLWLNSSFVTAHTTSHNHSVRGVAFSPTNPHLLASSGYDSTARLYNVNEFPNILQSYKPSCSANEFNDWERLSRVKWTCDGLNLVLTSSSAGCLYVYDIEKPEAPSRVLQQVSSVRLDRTALATHPEFPHLVAVAGDDKLARERGDISLIDLRTSEGAVRVMSGVHKNTVRDIEWTTNYEVLTASPDGTAKITNLDGRTHTTIHLQHSTDSIAYEGALSATFIPLSSSSSPSSHLSRPGTVVLGSSGIIEVWNIESSSPSLIESIDVPNDNLPIWRVKYNKRGTLMFVADDGGFVRMYHRKRVEGGGFQHVFIQDVLSHDADVSDLDISLHEDFVACASQSYEVGLVHIIEKSKDEDEDKAEDKDVDYY